MTISVEVHESHDIGNHYIRTIDFSSTCDWLQDLADEYISLRTTSRVPVNSEVFDGLEGFDVTVLERRIARAAIPDYQKGNLNVVRSDFGEVMCYRLLEEMFSTQFAYKPISARELVGMPARGLDAVGVETGPPLTLVIAEAKVSDDPSSPPSVVDQKSDSLRNQHLKHIGDLPKTVRKIYDQSRNSWNASACNALRLATFLIEEGRLNDVRLIACSVMVRPVERYQTTDFGSFLSNPDDYKPADVRFVIARVPGNIADLVRVWYDKFSSEGRRGE
jgi:hypothetical protein